MKQQEPCEGLSDENLAARCPKSPDFFACLMERYEGRLMRYIYRVTNVSREEAEDILQESFIKAYTNLNEFDTSLKFSSWMYRIVYHQVVSTYRKNKARPQGNTLDMDDDALTRIVSDENIVKDIERKQIAEGVRRALDMLDEKYREALVLFYLEEKDYREISDILQKPMGTVATLLSRAKKKLRTEIEKMNVSFEKNI